MRKFVLRHWRGDGQIIADVMKDYYHDYPKYRNIAPYKLSNCIHQVITQKEYLDWILEKGGIEYHNKMVLKLKLGDWNLIKNKRRTIKELLQLLLDNIELLKDGLCRLTYKVYLDKKISHDEVVILFRYLQKNKKVSGYGDFWFPKNEKEPRIEWLKEHIKKQDSFWNKLKSKILKFS